MLDRGDVIERVVERRGHLPVHGLRIVALDEDRPVPVTLEQGRQLVARDARQHGRVGDLEAVQVQHRQDGPVMHGIEELVLCQLVASGPVSASPSPTTQSTTRSGLSNAAP